MGEVPGGISVTLDLGYDPDANTNDNYSELQRTTSSTKQIGNEVPLTAPTRFGYEFDGWKIIGGTDERTLVKDAQSYTVLESDAVDGAITLTAQWTAKTFKIRFKVNSEVPVESIKVKVNEQTYDSLQNFADDYTKITWDASNLLLQFIGDITYGQTLFDFLQSIATGNESTITEMPVLIDTRTGEQKKGFAGWTTPGGAAVTSGMTFSLGEGNLIDARGDAALSAYIETITTTPILLTTSWETASYTLTTDVVEGWDILVDNQVQDTTAAENGKLSLTIPAGTQVSYRCSAAAPLNFSKWYVVSGGTRITPVERSYSNGDTYLYYDFSMPSADADATYGETWVNIADSPVTFAEDVSYNGRTIDGFWYAKEIDGMTPLFWQADYAIGGKDSSGTALPAGAYFYIWNFSDVFRVTSNDVKTQNQLTLVNAATVYLKECQMVATAQYSSRVSGRIIDSSTNVDTDFTAEGSLSDIGNIVLDNKINYKYTTNLYFCGGNTVACITQSKMNSASNYEATLNLYGDAPDQTAGVLNLGAVFASGDINVSDLTILEYSNDTYPDHCSYLFYEISHGVGYGKIVVSGNSSITSENKWIWSNQGYTRLTGSCEVNIGYLRGGYVAEISENAKVHVTKDVTVLRGFSLMDDAYMVIDGNMLVEEHDHPYNVVSEINTSKYLIVKGNRCEFINMTLASGTLIANDISLGRKATMSGGRIIANQITNYIADKRIVNADGSVRSTQNECGDTTAPFYTHANSYEANESYNFEGGEIFLFGKYNKSGNYYDLNYTTQTSGNPVGTIISGLGSLNADTQMPGKDDLINEINNNKGTNECFVLGNSSYNDNVRTRTIVFDGTEVYAAGNVNLLNNVNMKNGSVDCANHFSSAWDLNISGGTVNAGGTVGNSSSLVYTDEATKLKRWPQTRISGSASVTATRIGATTNTGNTRSTVFITGNTIIGKPTIVDDLYIHYIMSSGFTKPDTNPNSIRYTGTYGESWSTTTLQLVSDNLSSLTSVSIAAPTVSGSTAFWRLGSLLGAKLDSATNSQGYLTGDNRIVEFDPTDTGNEYLALYAAKSEYTLTVKEGKNYISSSSCAFNSSGIAQSVKANNEVTLKLTDSDMEKYTVIWYYANGLLHCVENTDTADNGRIRFLMPGTDTEIYITEILKLYLDEYEILFTDDGFQVEQESTRSDSLFTYAGSYRITLRGTEGKNLTAVVPTTFGENPVVKLNDNADDAEKAATRNRVWFETSNWDGESDSSNIRKRFIFSKIIQDYKSYTDLDLTSGVNISGNRKIAIEIEGVNELCMTKVPETSSVFYYGDQKMDDVIVVQDARKISKWNRSFLGNNAGKSGNARMERLTFMQRYQNTGLGRSSNAAGMFAMKDCIVKLHRYYLGCTIAYGYQQADLTNCDISILQGGADTGDSPFYGTSTVNITDSEVRYEVGGARNTGGFFTNVNQMNISGSSVINIKDMYSEGTTIRNVVNATSCRVTLDGSAVVTAERRLRLSDLTIKGNAKLQVTGLNSNPAGGYLFCPTIQMEGGTLAADYILLSGFNKTTDTSDNEISVAVIKDRLKNDQFIQESGSLTMTGGTVDAQTFLGGNKTTTINMTGGTVNAKQAGTINRVFGFAYYTPKNGEEYMYTASRIPVSAAVSIAGGTFNVSEYLGGMNSNVTVSGGQVNLADDAVLGMTEAQKQELAAYYSAKGDDIAQHTSDNCRVSITGGTAAVSGSAATGSIQAPYGSVSISGTDTKVKVHSLTAAYGTVEIQEASIGYPNPYEGTETGQYRSNKIGIWVTDTLSAKNLMIRNGAQVYAATAYAKITGGSGRLTVQQAGLYSFAYGEKGITRQDSDKSYNDTFNAADQTVFGTRIVTVSYQLNPKGEIFDSDISTIVNENPDDYIVNAKNEDNQYKINLLNASCRGYVFKGWYEDEAYTQPTQSLNTTIGNDVVLYAKWEKIKVKFAVTFEGDTIGSYDLADEFVGSAWNESGQNHISTKQPEISYGSKILSEAGVNLGEYTTKTLGITELQMNFGTYTDLINMNSLVSKDLAEAYREACKTNANAVVNLKVVNVQKLRVIVIFDLNKKDGKPSTAAFPGENAGTTIEDVIDVDKTISSSTKLADRSVTGGNSPGLIRPTAAGYTFIGWNTSHEATDQTSDGWVKNDDKFTQKTTVYAIWKANTYLIAFDAGSGNKITATNNAPNDGSPPTLQYYWVYDTNVNDENNFWYIDAGGDKVYPKELPYAWKEGYTFDQASGWRWTIGDETGTLDSTEALSAQVIAALNPAKGDPNGSPTDAALRLTAEYSRVKVTYDLGGGKWTNEAPSGTPNYGDPLAGYTKTDTAETGGQIIGTPVTGANGSKYSVVSTTSGHYNEKDDYVDSDYRNTLSKKGYTFQGWQDENGIYVGTTPRFADVKLTAVWAENTYSLQLCKSDTEGSTYSDFHAGSPNSPATVTGVKVGEEINVSADLWPSRNGEWYACNKGATSPGDNDKRYLLGFTFAALDPGKTGDTSGPGYDVYINYAKSVIALENAKSLYQNRESGTGAGAGYTEGTVFTLPEDADYRKAIEDSYSDYAGYTIPDYPDGSTIKLYGIYRERSLVFVERYVEPDGTVQRTVKESGPWETYSDYPNRYISITSPGYALTGWYVNGTTTAAEVYPSDVSNFNDKLNAFKEEAKRLGTYDIMVYTVYAAQVSRNVTLTAQSDAASAVLSQDEYTIPANIESGMLSMKLTNGSSLKFVPKTEMLDHQYDQAWPDSLNENYSANNTVSVDVSISSATPKITKNLSECDSDGTLNFGQEVGAGDKITLTLYHSKVMSQTIDFKDIELQFQFSGNSQGDQRITDNLTVQIVPSEYQVIYTVNLPEDAEDLTVSDWKGFGKVSGQVRTVTKEVTLDYGDTLMDDSPILEGYTIDRTDPSSWTYGGQQYRTLTMTPENSGPIILTRGYKPQKYSFCVDADILGDWDVTYTDGSGNEVSYNTPGTQVDIDYHATVTFKPKDPDNPPKPQYVTLTLTDDEGNETTVKLSSYGTPGSGGSYSFLMPASDVAASKVTTQTLYLDDGTINITKNGYTQNGVTKEWLGDYVILQCADNNSDFHETANVLTLAEDLRDRTIQLGDLHLTSDNSIEVKEGAKAVLSANYDGEPSTITAKNILAGGQDTSLKLHTGLMESGFGTDPTKEDIGKKAEITLAPAVGSAAIGGNTGNPIVGTLDVENVNLSMTMPNADVSTASGIGAGTQNATQNNGTVTVLNCDITVAECSATTVYAGAWIGGAGVSSVTIDSSVLTKADANHMAGPVIADGYTVSIQNSSIGTEANYVSDPIHARDALTITGSTIYQHIQDDLTGSRVNTPIGTENGNMTTVKDASVIRTMTSGVGEFAELYSGYMQIQDAASNVNISNTQILEVSNGSITITDTKVTQNGKEHSNTGSYLLLEEGQAPSDEPDLTITSLAENASVTVKQPKVGSGVTVGDLTVHADTNLELEGSLMVKGQANLGEEAGLAVKAGQSTYGITFEGTGDIFAGGKSYSQESGTLTSTNADFGAAGSSATLDVTLTGVTASVPNLYAKNLTIDGGSVEATATDSNSIPNGKIGSLQANNPTATTVTIKNGASVTANTIGALGSVDSTFTLVKLEGSNTITGTLVQDHYRLAYNTSGAAISTDNLPKTVRTSDECTGSVPEAASLTVLSPTDGVPTIPVESAGIADCWFLREADGESDFKRYGLQKDGSAPAGLEGIRQLKADTLAAAYGEDVSPAAADGTQTLTVHVWLKAVGETAVKKGRLFQTFTDGSQSVTTQSNGAFTAMLTSTGNKIQNRDYQVTFTNALPVGTVLTLTVIGASGTADQYYYYTVSASDYEAGKKIFKFSEFKKMGSDGGNLSLEVTDAGNETFLLSVDFAEAESIVVSNQTMTFELLPDKRGSDTIPMGSELTYSTTAVTNGSLAADGSQVTILTLPADADNLSGQKLYLAAKLTEDGGREVTVPYGASATLVDIPGTWVSRDTVLFEIGDYADVSSISQAQREVAFSGLSTGNYELTWTLVYGTEPRANILGNVISNTAEGSITVTNPIIDEMTAPWLSVQMAKQTHVISVGEGKTISFTYQTTESSVTATVEKQGLLCDFNAYNGSDISTSVSSVFGHAGIATVEFGPSLEAGTYRICFSIKEDSREDDVYFTFIVE
ncbi:MAG: InlB B-repeat-containing protein [Eubacteriales bacterium]|nr:InlB B-repeat-containing protein [Eubacteriales bacterium]